MYDAHLPLAALRRQVLSALVTLICVGTACKVDRPDDLYFQDSVHPTQQNLPSAEDDQYLVAREHKEGEGFIELADYPHRIIGKADGEPSELLVNIQDLAADQQGNVYVLDARGFGYPSLQVFVYNDRGVLSTTLGGRGAAPGQFRNPSAVDLTRDGKILLVMDWHRVHVFERNSSGYQFARSFQSPGRTDLCAMNEEAFVLGYSSEQPGVIHRYALDGTLVTSFGEPYDDPNERIRSVLSDEGLLACNVKHGVIGSARTRIPILTGYSQSGNIAWRVRFADFEPQTASLSSKPSELQMRYLRLPGTSVFTSLIGDPPDHFLVQYTTRGDTSRAIPRKRHLFRIQAATGASEYVGWTDEAVAGVDSIRVITRANEEFPRVTVFEAMEAIRPARED